MKIDYSKPIDFEKIDDLSIIDESKLESRQKREYKRLLRSREIAQRAAEESTKRATVVQEQTSGKPASDFIPTQGSEQREAETTGTDKTKIGGKSPANTKKQTQTKKKEIMPITEEKTKTPEKSKPAATPKEKEKRYIGPRYDKLIEASVGDERQSVVLYINTDTYDELRDQSCRRRKEKKAVHLLKVALQMVLEMPDKEYADLKLRAQAEGKSVGTIVHEAVKKHLYG